MVAVLDEKKEDHILSVAEMPGLKPKRIPISEDIDLHIVRFQNMEQAGVPLEFSAGPPVSEGIRNYVLKDGLVYNLGKRLITYLNNLNYPIYENVIDPNFPKTGVTRSMQTGVKRRFSLVPVDDPDVTVYEHLREKLNHKVLPGALKNSSDLHSTLKRSGDVNPGKEAEITRDTNLKLERDNHTLKSQVEDMVEKVNTVLSENKILKTELEKGVVRKKDSK